MTEQVKQVVVLGAGYAGLMAAMRLAKKSGQGVTLINAGDTFQERVRNHQLAAGQTVRQYSLPELLDGTRVTFLQGMVTAWQPGRRQVTVRTAAGSRQVEYDYLVYALGSFMDTGRVPGVRPFAYTLDEPDAAALARRLPEVAARQGGRLLVVGGGNTGVEVATEVAEAYPGLRVTLATRHSFAPNLSAGARAYIRRAFERRRVTFRENTAVTELKESCAVTASGDTIPFDLCIWTCGFAVSDLPRQAGLHVNERGQILIDPAMRSLSHPEVFAVGDAAMPVQEPGAPIRMSLYTAIMMGAHGADCLAAELRGRQPTPFGLSYMALGLSLGRRDGVAQFLGWSTDKPLKLILTGRLAARFREFFVHFAVWAIRAQRVAPWIFEWPGRHKMRRAAAVGTKEGWTKSLHEVDPTR